MRIFKAGSILVLLAQTALVTTAADSHSSHEAHAETYSLISQALDSDDQYVRHKAIESLRSNLERNAASVPSELVVEALRSDDYYLRHQTLHGLKNVRIDLFPDAFEVALESDDQYVRRTAAEILAAADLTTGAPAQIPESSAPEPRPSIPDPEGYEAWERRWSLQIPEWRDDEFKDFRFRYNRVEGAYLGWQVPRQYEPNRFLTHYGEVGRALGLEEWQYRGGASLYTYYRTPDAYSHLASIGFEIYDLIDTQDGWLISEEENSLSAVLFHRDFMDFYRRFGLGVYSGHNVGGILQLTARYNRDQFEFRDRSVEWALMSNMFARQHFRPNPGIDEGVISSGRIDVQLDTRSSAHAPHQGWLINGLFERAGGILEGDYRFKRYLLDLRRYQPVGVGTRLDVRLRSGSAKGNLPSQYLYDLGGFSTIRGYPFKALTGDRMVLVNFEYWLDVEEHADTDVLGTDAGLGLFFDAGAAWFADDSSDPFEGVDNLVTETRSSDPRLRRSFGFAVGEEDQDGFRVEFARPLDGPIQDWDVLARFSRSF